MSNQITVQYEADEACVVLEKKFWDHMIEWYSIMANESRNPQDKANWVSIINAVEFWVGKTYAPKSNSQAFDDDDDDWN